MSPPLWHQYGVTVPDSRFVGEGLPLCGLCGNGGVIQTVATSQWDIAVRAYCICPNGRYVRRMAKIKDSIINIRVGEKWMKKAPPGYFVDPSRTTKSDSQKPPGKKP